MMQAPFFHRFQETKRIFLHEAGVNFYIYLLLIIGLYYLIKKFIDLKFKYKDKALQINLNFNKIKITTKPIDFVISEQRFFIVGIILPTFIFSFIVISKITPYITLRYLMPVIPLLFITVSSILFQSLNPAKIAIFLLLICSLGINIKASSIYWYQMNPGVKIINQIISKAQITAIDIQRGTGWHPAIEQNYLFQRADNTLLLSEENINKLDELKSSFNHKIILTIHNNVSDQDLCLNQIKEIFNINEPKYLYSLNGNTYLISLK